MKIKMRSLAASPYRVLEPGKTYNLPRDEAQELIAGGYAVLDVDAVKVERIPPQPDPEDIESAVDEDDNPAESIEE